MTERQLELLDFIRDSLAERGVAPSLREMKQRLRIKSGRAVQAMVDALVRAGLLEREPGRARGLRILGQVSLAAVATERLEAELRRRRRAPMWSRDFREGLAQAEPRP